MSFQSMKSVILLAAAILFAVASAHRVAIAQADAGSSGESPAAAEPSGLAAAAAMERVLAEAIAAGEKSIVAIARVQRENEAATVGPGVRRDPFDQLRQGLTPKDPSDPDFVPSEYGTGVIIDQAGLILTHYSIIQEKDEHWVTTSDRKSYPAKIRSADPRSGLAILSVDASDLTPIRMANAKELRKGHIVIALGNPFGIARDGSASASWGIVSNLARKASIVPSDNPKTLKPTLHHFGTLIQTDAKLNFGTSGGALLNLRGEMVGLTTTLAATAGFDLAAGYAIPIDDTFLRVIDILKAGREVEYGLLGVKPRNLTPEELRQGKIGSVVGEVVGGTPAELAGIEIQDIITHVDGRPVYDADGLVLEVSRMGAAATVRLTVRRQERVRQLDVELAKSWVHGKKIISDSPAAWRGLTIDYATAVDDEYEMHSRMGEVDFKGCVAVVDVAQDSPAWKEGLRPKMFISHVGNVRVRKPAEFYAAVAEKEGAVRVRLTVPDDRQPVRTIPPGS